MREKSKGGRVKYSIEDIKHFCLTAKMLDQTLTQPLLLSCFSFNGFQGWSCLFYNRVITLSNVIFIIWVSQVELCEKGIVYYGILFVRLCSFQHSDQ